MTVTSWTEYRVYQGGVLVYTACSEKDARTFAEIAKKNPLLNGYVCKEVSVSELPKRKFAL